MAFASLSLGAIGIETAYLFVMAVLLAACTAPGLYYLYRNDIEGRVVCKLFLQCNLFSWSHCVQRSPTRLCFLQLDGVRRRYFRTRLRGLQR